MAVTVSVTYIILTGPFAILNFLVYKEIYKYWFHPTVRITQRPQRVFYMRERDGVSGMVPHHNNGEIKMILLNVLKEWFHRRRERASSQ